MTSAERRALDGSSIYPVARARNVCFCQRPPRERERTREKEIILALARNYATIQVLNAYNLFRVATARVSCAHTDRPVSERRRGGKKSASNEAGVYTRIPLAHPWYRVARGNYRHRRNRISKREISNAYSNEVDHSRITSFNVYFPSFFPPLSIRMTRILDEYVTNTRTLVNFYAKQTNFVVSRSSNIVDCRQSLRTIDRRVIVD